MSEIIFDVFFARHPKAHSKKKRVDFNFVIKSFNDQRGVGYCFDFNKVGQDGRLELEKSHPCSVGSGKYQHATKGGALDEAMYLMYGHYQQISDENTDFYDIECKNISLDDLNTLSEGHARHTKFMIDRSKNEAERASDYERMISTLGESW